MYFGWKHPIHSWKMYSQRINVRHAQYITLNPCYMPLVKPFFWQLLLQFENSWMQQNVYALTQTVIATYPNPRFQFWSFWFWFHVVVLVLVPLSLSNLLKPQQIWSSLLLFFLWFCDSTTTTRNLRVYTIYIYKFTNYGKTLGEASGPSRLDNWSEPWTTPGYR